MKKEFLIGIDLGSTSVKMVRLARRDGKFVLVRTVIRELQHSEDPAVQEREMLAALKELAQDLPLNQSRVVAAFNSPETGLRVITTPPMPKKELREAIRLEGARYFPFPIENSLIEFEILGTVVEKSLPAARLPAGQGQAGAKKYRTAAAATPMKTAESIFSLLKQAGIHADQLIPSSYAFYPLEAAEERGAGEIRCLMDVGGLASELVILKGNQPIFTRKIPVGGRDFTRSLTEVLLTKQGEIHFGWEEAEKIKREVGFSRESEHPLLEDRISLVHITSMLRSPLERLAAEIDRCLDYYQEESDSGKIETLILFGRGSRLPGLAEALSESLGLKVERGDPLAGKKIQSPVHSSGESLGEFAVAIGAALSLPTGLNLLPPEVKEATQRTLRRALFQSLAVSALLFLVLVYMGMKFQLANYKKRLAVAEYELASSRPELERALAQSLASQILAGEPYWEDVFKELSQLIPQEIYLTQLNLAGKRLTLRGVNLSGEKEQALSGLVQSLEQGIFSDVKLMNVKAIPDQAASEFELSAWVDQ